MSIFVYRAINRERKSVDGQITADSPRQARDLLRQQGLLVRELSAPTSRRSWLTRRRGTKTKLASAVRELATLLSVGVSVDESLAILVEQNHGVFQSSLMTLRERVSSGVSLAVAMNEQPDVFDELTRRMVEVGENSGNLDEVLRQLATYQDRSLQIKDRVVGALLYPAIVFAASIGVAVFLMIVVVPMLISGLVDAGQTLPWPTRLLKFMSDTLVENGVGVLFFLIVLVALASWSYRSTSGRRRWQELFLRVPVVGSMVRRQAISRAAMVISTLLGSGIEYLNAAEIAARTTTHLPLREALGKSSELINGGIEIGEALRASTYFPPMVVHIFAIGQATGQLEELLDRLATDYDQQVASLSHRLASVLEPILIIVLAIFVGFILLATLLPILEAGNVLS